jgi:hypothetical protein
MEMTNNKQQTAVDYIFSQLPAEYGTTRGAFDVYQQAKEMEKQQRSIELPSDEEIKKVLIQYNDYLFTFIDKDEIGINVETEDVIKWYNQTYGGGKQ